MVKRQTRKRNPEATEFARNQRKTANEFANDVWQMVRNRRCCGVKFRREFRIAPYTVDFCCVELKLIVEVDGKSHFTDAGIAADRARDEYLRGLGYEVLRIPGFDVLKEPALVRERIVEAIRGSDFPPLPPARK